MTKNVDLVFVFSMAADLLRRRLLPFTKVRSTCRLDSLALSRHHALLPERSWSGLSSPSAPIRSCFQWMFHPSCDVLNFPPVDIELGQDGNPVIVPEFRRMWVSGSMKFHSPFFPDDTASKETTIVDVSSRETKSQGPVIFVSRESTMTTMSTTEQSQKGGSRGRMTETTTHAFLQSTRYVPPPPLNAAAAAPSLPVSERHPLLLEETVKDIDSVLLFKYSALTYNAHRIHYDLEHTMQVEGYPGLVVHGPWISSLLLDAYQHLCMESLSMCGFSGFKFDYRATSPMFLGEKLHISAVGHGKSVVKMIAKTDEGRVVMEAKATRI